MSTQKLTRLAMFLALSLILSYLESLIPVSASIPGIKIGLANIITMYMIYCYSIRETVVIMFLRVIISGFMFSGLTTIIFGILGGMVCIIVMWLLKRTSLFSIMGVSMAGAVAHNAGQILAAYIVIQNAEIIYYMPYLCISGLVTGLLVGYISALIIRRFKTGQNY